MLPRGQCTSCCPDTHIKHCESEVVVLTFAQLGHLSVLSDVAKGSRGGLSLTASCSADEHLQQKEPNPAAWACSCWCGFLHPQIQVFAGSYGLLVLIYSQIKEWTIIAKMKLWSWHVRDDQCGRVSAGPLQVVELLLFYWWQVNDLHPSSHADAVVSRSVSAFFSEKNTHSTGQVRTKPTSLVWTLTSALRSRWWPFCRLWRSSRNALTQYECVHFIQWLTSLSPAWFVPAALLLFWSWRCLRCLSRADVCTFRPSLSQGGTDPVRLWEPPETWALSSQWV